MNHAKWQEVINRLHQWMDSEELDEDDDFQPPDKEVICRALAIAKTLQMEDFLAPDSVVLAGDGGIVFRRKEGDVTATVHFWPDLTIEVYHISRGILLRREKIGITPGLFGSAGMEGKG